MICSTKEAPEQRDELLLAATKWDRMPCWRLVLQAASGLGRRPCWRARKRPSRCVDRWRQGGPFGAGGTAIDERRSHASANGIFCRTAGTQCIPCKLIGPWQALDLMFINYIAS